MMKGYAKITTGVLEDVEWPLYPSVLSRNFGKPAGHYDIAYLLTPGSHIMMDNSVRFMSTGLCRPVFSTTLRH